MIGARIAIQAAKAAQAKAARRASKGDDEDGEAESGNQLLDDISDMLNHEDDDFKEKRKAALEEEEEVEIERTPPVRPPAIAGLGDRLCFQYLRIAWWIHSKVVSSSFFEGFIMLCIIAVGVTTGLDVNDEDENNMNVRRFVNIVQWVTFVVFVVECVLKIVAQGARPQQYFFAKNGDGLFNCLDFALVVLSIMFLGSSSAGAIRTLRLGRLVRLLDIIKSVPELRVIVVGLIAGLRSVGYIVLLLLLVIYLYAVLGTIVLGENDPAYFGTVSVSMLTLFQVATLTSLASVAHTS